MMLFITTDSIVCYKVAL